MSEQAIEQEDAPETAKKKKKISGKKLVMFAALPVVLGGLYMSGMLDSVLGGGETAEGEHGAETAAGGHDEASAEEEITDDHGAEMFYLKMPEMTINLRSNNQRATYLQLEITLELTSEEALHEVERVLPRVVDQFQTHLRELHAADLEGSAAVFRLREELLYRVNAAIAPARVRDVLFEAMLVQG